MKVLIIGANGMLGHSLFRYYSKKYEVQGVSRSPTWNEKIKPGFDVSVISNFENFISSNKPDLVFNCVGIIKQIEVSMDAEASIQTNALWPHQLAKICRKHNSKVIHFSTDCVFSGKDGMYTENSFTDSRDLYGLTKYLGEVHLDHCLTLRTSIIGHEINSSNSLVDWFLSQEKVCNGYRKAIYGGFPTNSLARIIDNYVLEKFMAGKVHGLLHVSSNPISKYDLLKLISEVYDKKIKINPSDDFQIDRSLDSSRFRKEFNYKPEDWSELIIEMRELYLEMRANK